MILPPEPVSPQDVAEHYDSLDLFYRDVWGEELHHGYWETGDESSAAAIEQLRETMLALAEIEPGNAVCDVGCGYGTAALYLAESRQAQVTGVTLSEVQCAEAERKAARSGSGALKPRFLCCDWLENPFEDASFEVVISIECLSHVSDKADFFAEAKRVLKRGGRLSLTAWTVRETTPKWANRWLLAPICHEGRFAGLVSSGELESLVTASGLTVERIETIGPQVKKTWRVIFRRLVKRVLTKKEYRRFLRQNLRSDRFFAFTVIRVLIAYETGMLDYAILKARRW